MNDALAKGVPDGLLSVTSLVSLGISHGVLDNDGGTVVSQKLCGAGQ